LGNIILITSLYKIGYINKKLLSPIDRDKSKTSCGATLIGKNGANTLIFSPLSYMRLGHVLCDNGCLPVAPTASDKAADFGLPS